MFNLSYNKWYYGITEWYNFVPNIVIPTTVETTLEVRGSSFGEKILEHFDLCF